MYLVAEIIGSIAINIIKKVNSFKFINSLYSLAQIRYKDYRKYLKLIRQSESLETNIWVNQ